MLSRKFVTNKAPMLCVKFSPEKTPPPPMLSVKFVTKKAPMLCVKFSPKKPPTPMLSVKFVTEKAPCYALNFHLKCPPMLSVKFVPKKASHVKQKIFYLKRPPHVNPIRSGLFQTANDRGGGGGFKSPPPLQSRKLLCHSSPYHTCAFYQVFQACSIWNFPKIRDFDHFTTISK